MLNRKCFSRTAKAKAQLLAIGLLSLVASCPADQGSENTPAPLSWPLDTILGDGEVRCGLVTRSTELIGGPLAYGQVGHAYRCHNAQIRFLVQGAERPFGNSSRGGNLIDLDWVRESETEDGKDAFREFVVAYGVQEVEVEDIEVVNDGQKEGPGRIRVSGHLGFLSLAPQAEYLSQDLPVFVQTDYILYPDVDYVEIETTLFNESDEQLFSVMYADFVAFGGVNQTLSPAHGFKSVDLFSYVPFLASGGSDVSYAYVCSDGDPLVVFAEGGITLPVCRDDGIVVLSESYSRYIVVGDGTLESASKKAYALKGTKVGTVIGHVTTAAAERAAGVFVSAVAGVDLNDPNAFTVNRTKTQSDGSFQLTLPPGDHWVVAFEEGKGRSESAPVSVIEDGIEEVDLVLPEKGKLLVETQFLDRNGQATGTYPAKLSIQPLGNGYEPNEALGEFKRNGLVRSIMSRDGRFDVEISPGSYRVYITRGFEFTRFERDVDIVSQAPTELMAELQHVLDTTGLVAAEFHQHTLASTDSDVPLGQKVLENAAEGIEFAASTDHDNISDFTPYLVAHNLEEHLVCIPGNEVSYQSIGHFNVYPWNLDPDDPLKDVGSRVWWQKTVPELFTYVRRLAGDPIVQINHPRSSSAGLFGALRLNPIDATRYERNPPQLPSLPATIYQEWPTDFDAVEVNGNLGVAEDYTVAGYETMARTAETDPGDVPVLADYFSLLGAGLNVAAMGNSDSHHWGDGTGYPRNFVRVEKDAPREIEIDAIRNAIRSQRVAVGEGCLIEFRLNGERPMGIGEMLSAGDLASLRVLLQAPPHVTIQKLELYQNGMVQNIVFQDGAIQKTDVDGVDGGSIVNEGVLSLDLSGVTAVDEVIRLDAAVQNFSGEDFVLVALARGGSGLAPTGGGSPFCFTAPLYVDMDGGGFVPWLASTQTVAPLP